MSAAPTSQSSAPRTAESRGPASQSPASQSPAFIPQLFAPLQIRSVTLRNRVVLASMHQYAANQGFATDWHLVNAGKYAAGGCGLVMAESTKVERRGCGTVGDLGLWKDEFIPGLRRITDFITAQGATPGIQLGHSGRKARLTRPWEGQHPLTQAHPEMFD
jgi:2,4-dienoyl-CoA reductase-like NADH-dependent reductase (Old Yellow Enzyme family)